MSASGRRTVSSGPVIVVFGLPRHWDRHGWGWLLGRRFLQLPRTGRRSTRTQTTVLEVVRLTGSAEGHGCVWFGPGSDRLRDIKASARAEISIGRGSFPAAFRVVSVDEAAAVLADDERRNRVAAPMIGFVLRHLLGWRYDGAPEDASSSD